MPSVAEIYLEQGRRMADAKRRQGESSANLAMNIGNQFGAAVQQIGQHYADAPRRELQTLQLDEARRGAAGAKAETEAEGRLRELFATTPTPDPKAIIGIVGPERGTKIVTGLLALQDTEMQRFKTQQEVIAATLAGMDALPENLRKEIYPSVRQTLTTRGVIKPEDAPEAYDATWFQQARNFGQAPAKPAEGFTLNPGDVRFGPDGKQIATVAPAPEKPEKVTFGPMKRVVLSDGKKLTIRERSDGSIVDMKGTPIEDQGIDLYEKPTAQGGQPRALTPNAESQLIGRLATQWNTATKPARELDRQVSIMREGMKAVEKGDLAQGGQAVLVTFQKILDPTSVVRESEFDRSREGLSLMQRATAAVERLSKGGAGVPLDELKKYAALAEQIAKAQRDSRLTAIKERLGKNADRYNIPRELVFEEELPGGGTEPPVTVTPKNIVTTPPPDNSGTWKWDGQKWVKK